MHRHPTLSSIWQGYLQSESYIPRDHMIRNDWDCWQYFLNKKVNFSCVYVGITEVIVTDDMSIVAYDKFRLCFEYILQIKNVNNLSILTADNRKLANESQKTF